MKTKSFFSLSLMTAGLLAGTALSGSAWGADLQARTDWAISRVASMTQGSYCTMAQKFDSNTVLTIAKNNSGEYSLAFDFQAPKFSLDKELTLSVKAGTGSSQTYTVHAQTPEALVLNLGKDEGFISELRRSGKMQLDLDGKSYTFNTAKFSEAQDELDTCMTGRKAQVREAKEEAPAEKAEKTISVASAAPAPSKPDKAAISAEDLVLAPVDTSVTSPVVQKKEETPPAAKIQPAQDRLTRAADAERGRENLSKFAEENKALKAQLAEARKAQEDAARKSGDEGMTVQALKEENLALKKQLQDEAKNKATVPAADPDAEENMRDQIRDLKSQLEIAESESATLKEQIDNMQKESESGQLKVAGGNWDLEQATRRYQESQREIRRLGALLEQDRVKCKEEKKNIEYMLFDPEVTKSAQIAKLGELEDEVQARDARIAELETALKSGNKLEDNTDQLKARDAKIAELEAALKSNDKADEIRVKDARIAELEAALKSGEQANDKADQLKAKDARIAELEAALKAARKQDEAAAKTAPDKKESGARMAAASQAADAVKTADAAEKEPSIWERLLSADATPSAPEEAKPAAKPASGKDASKAQPQSVSAREESVQTVVVSHTGLQSPEEFASLLQAAGVKIQGSVQTLKQPGASDTYKAYSWRTGELSGSAEQRVLRNRDGFEPAVQEYIERARSRCAGEFKAVPAQTRLIGVNMAEGYEISCTGGQSGSSASVLFSYRDGILTTIAHEGHAGSMTTAMNVRDRIAARIMAN